MTFYSVFGNLHKVGLLPKDFLLRQEEIFHGGAELFGDVESQQQRWIGAVGLDAIDGFTAYTAGIGKILLGEPPAETIFFDFIFHGVSFVLCDVFVILCDNYITNHGNCKVFFDKILKFFAFYGMIYYVT